MSWTDEAKEAVVSRYLEENPTPETTVEITKMLADELDVTTNGVRMVLSTAGVYIKKESGASKDTADKPKRASKADSIAALTAAMEEAGHEIDESILDKLTGKAAQYFLKVFQEV